MDVETALRERRSVNALRADVPSRAVIQRILDAAVWAPNHHLTEPWRFDVLTGQARRTMGESVAQAVGRDADLNDPLVRGEIKSCRTRLERAPVVIVVSQVVDADPVTALEDYAACCCATQNLMLAAHSDGLATKWRTGAMTDYPAAKNFLGLRKEDRIVAYVYVGYPSPQTSPDNQKRTTPEVTWHGWDSQQD